MNVVFLNSTEMNSMMDYTQDIFPVQRRSKFYLQDQSIPNTIEGFEGISVNSSLPIIMYSEETDSEEPLMYSSRHFYSNETDIVYDTSSTVLPLVHSFNSGLANLTLPHEMQFNDSHIIRIVGYSALMVMSAIGNISLLRSLVR